LTLQRYGVFLKVQNIFEKNFYLCRKKTDMNDKYLIEEVNKLKRTSRFQSIIIALIVIALLIIASI
jgi:hypothetical protein